MALTSKSGPSSTAMDGLLPSNIATISKLREASRRKKLSEERSQLKERSKASVARTEEKSETRNESTPESVDELQGPELTFQEKQDAWARGDLTYLLHPAQMKMRKAWLASDAVKFVAQCSRRIGKSFWLCVEGIEDSLKNPNWRIPYAAPTARMVTKIVIPLMRQILADCPEDLLPRYLKVDGVWVFPNGSEIHVAGCDGQHYERLRGTAAHKVLVDEAAFIDDLEYVIQDVLMPQTLTTGGRILLASTPPTSPDHAFVRYATEAERVGAYIHQTIYDNPLITPKQIALYMEESGGEESTTWRREYLAESVTDSETCVIPEFDQAARREICVDVKRPEHFDCYVSMDPGFVDLCVVLFGYYDFVDATVVVEDELVLTKTNTDELALAILGRESALWGQKKPLLRVSDADLQIINDLTNLYRLTFSPTPKYNKEAAINAVRLAVRNRALRISPKCKTLIAHMSNAIWANTRNIFARSADHGHFDAIDALVYLVRNVIKSRNPYPRLAPGVRPPQYFVDQKMTTQNRTSLSRIFGRKRLGHG